MSSTDHLALAREYITIAESVDSKREAYEKAADELIAWVREVPTRSYRDADRQLGRANDYCGKLVRWRTNGGRDRHLPFGGTDRQESRDKHTAKTILKDPEQRQRVIAELPPETQRDIVTQALTSSPDARRAMQDAIKTDTNVAAAADAGLEQHPRAPVRAERSRAQSDPMDLLLRFRQMRREMSDIAELVKDERVVVNDEVRELLREEVAWLRNALGWIDSGLSGDSLDEAFARILTGES